MLSAKDLCNGLIIHPEELYRPWCVAVCDRGTPKMRSWLTLGRSAKEKKSNINKWTGMWHAWDRRQNSYKISVGKPEGKGPNGTGDLGADGRHLHVHRCDNLRSNLVCLIPLNGT